MDDIGLDLWPASEVLCRFLADHPALAKHTPSVLELGAGLLPADATLGAGKLFYFILPALL